MIAFSIYSLLTSNKISEAQANPNRILKETVYKSLESPAMDSILMKYFKGQNNNYCSLIDKKVSEAQANPNQKLKKTVNDSQFESPVMDTVPCLLIGLKVPEAQANTNQNLKKTVDDTSFESPAMDTISNLLIGLKVPEAGENTNQNLKKTVNTSFESSDVDSVPMKYYPTKYYHKSYLNLQAKKPYFAPQCYVIEKRLLLNEPTNPTTIQKDTDWTKKLLEKWC